MLSQRIEKLSKRVRDTQPTIDLDRARLITEFYTQPSMDNYILRRAKAFKHYLDNMAIFIDDDEQLAGHQGSRVQSVILHPDTTKWLYDDFDTLDKRPSDNLAFRSEQDKKDLWEIVNKWRGNTFGDFASSLIDDDTKRMIEAGVLTHGISNQSTMNHSPDYDNFIKRGYRYYIDECREKLAAHKINDVYDMEQEIAWQSMVIVMESIINLAHRYADLAEQKAARCKDAKRKEELLTMAENCRTVPENPPQTFMQATQLVWFHHLSLIHI